MAKSPRNNDRTRRTSQARKRRRSAQSESSLPSQRPSQRSSRSRRHRELDPRDTTRRRTNPFLWAIPVAILLAVAFFFTERNRSDTTGQSTSSDATADGLLREMQAAYKNLNAYSDTTRIQFAARLGDRWVDESAIIRTAYQRPNFLRFSAERPGTEVVIDVASDGEHLRAQVVDPEIDNFDNQVVERAAPELMSIPALYSATEYTDVSRPGELKNLLSQLPAPLQISQLSLLLNQEEEPLQTLLATATETRRLEDARLPHTLCYRVAITGPTGPFIFWIASDTKLLQRIEFPVPSSGSNAAEVNPTDATKPPGSLVCDYLSISTEPRLKDVFGMKIRPQAKVVRNFVLPPTDVAPTRLNLPAGDFEFTNLSGQPISSAQFDGKITVLCWFDSRPANRVALTKLEAVQEAVNDASVVDVANPAEFEFVLVCTEPATKFSHDDVKSLLQSWGIGLPVVRDLTAVGRDRFEIQATPTIVVLDAKGIVQLNETGIDPNLDQQLPGVLQLIADGKPIAADYLDFLNKRRRVYEKQLAAASVQAPTQAADSLPAEIPPATVPKRLKLSKLWGQSELSEPGNIYPHTHADNRVTYFVHDGWKEIVELGSDGSILRRHQVADSKAAAIRRLKMATDRTGRQYALGWSTLSRQVALLNDAWKTVLAYPPVEQPHSGVLSADLADLDGDGELEMYIAFAQPDGTDIAVDQQPYQGIHCVGLDGKLRWKNDRVPPARSMTHSLEASGKNFLLTTNRTGQIVPIDAQGTTQRDISVGSRAIHELFASDPEDPNAVFCGFSFLPAAELLAVGIQGDLKEAWALPMAPGIFRHQINLATAANWFADGVSEESDASEGSESTDSPYWVFAGPDGSVSIVSHTDEFDDRFQTGQELTGIAAATLGDANVLLLSSADGVSAYKVEKLSDEE